MSRRWQIAYVDGTAPHVREVPLPAASGAYLDLGQFYRCEELIPKLPELMRLTERYRATTPDAYDELRQAKALHDELESVYNPTRRFRRRLQTCRRPHPKIKNHIVNRRKMV